MTEYKFILALFSLAGEQTVCLHGNITNSVAQKQVETKS
jgi:hypothetical protein